MFVMLALVYPHFTVSIYLVNSCNSEIVRTRDVAKLEVTNTWHVEVLNDFFWLNAESGSTVGVQRS